MLQKSLRYGLGVLMCAAVGTSGVVQAAPQASNRSASAVAPEAWLGRVQKAYAKQGDFSAHFTQTYVDKLSGRQREEAGQMWVKADGRVRFAYQVPEPKDFVFDGNQAYFYEPDNAQVTVFEHFADSPVAQAMQFLWGQGDISRLFVASACPQTPSEPEVCPKAAPSETILRLVPRTPLPTVHHVALVIDTASARVLRSVTYDPLDNQTRYSFAHSKAGAPIEAKWFAFTIPSGVSVLRAPPMDKAVPPSPVQ